MNAIEQLIDALQALPGVGPKSAQRMALHVLQRNKDGGKYLAESMAHAIVQVGLCDGCRTLSDAPLCELCTSQKRSDEVLCVVESPADIWAIEQAGGFSGRYFVLNGRLSPIEGIGPEELGLPQLKTRVETLQPKEVILATNPTVEGEATAHYVSRLLEATVTNITRIAHGVPLGGELEYIDGGTIAHALAGRRQVN